MEVSIGIDAIMLLSASRMIIFYTSRDLIMWEEVTKQGLLEIACAWVRGIGGDAHDQTYYKIQHLNISPSDVSHTSFWHLFIISVAHNVIHLKRLLDTVKFSGQFT